MTIRFPIVLFLFFTIETSFPAHAQFGTIEEITQATVEGKEPPCFRRLTEALARKLRAFAIGKHDTPEGRLALFRTLEQTLYSARKVAWDAAKDEASYHAELESRRVDWGTPQQTRDAEYRAVQGAKLRLTGAERNSAWYCAVVPGICIVQIDASNALWNKVHYERSAYGRNTLSPIPITLQRIIDGRIPAALIESAMYRVEEWILLNYCLENAKAIFEETYAAILKVPIDWMPNPFVDEAQWLAFRTEAFGRILYEKSRLFLQPLWSVFDSMMYGPAMLQFLLGRRDPGSVLFKLDRNVASHILGFVAFRL